MAIFLLLFGIVTGMFIAYDGAVGARILAGIFLLIGFIFALYKKKWVFLLIGVAIGVLVALIPCGPFNGDVNGVALVLRSKKNYILAQIGLRKYYVPIQNNTYQTFDFIHLEGTSSEVMFTHYESRFDFKSYLNTLGVRSSIDKSKTSLAFGLPIRVKQWENSFLEGLSKDGKTLYSGLLFATTDSSSELYELSSSLGVFHLLSASGILFALSLRLLKRVLYPFELHFKTDIAVAIYVCLFIPIGLIKVGVMRIFCYELLRIFFSKKRKFELDSDSFNAVIGIAFFACNPYIVFQQGFLLSFSLPYFLKLCSYLRYRVNHRYQKLVTLLLIHLFLLPVIIDNGGIHLLAIPYAYLLSPLGLIVQIVGYFAFLTVPIYPVLEFFVMVLHGILKVLNAIDFVVPVVVNLYVFAAIYYPMILGCIYLMEIGFCHHVWKIAGVFAFAIGLSMLPMQYLVTSQVSFIDVGQGDAILLRDHDKVVLLDTGGIASFDIAEESLIPYLKKEHIYHIDAIIASHHDYDHIGGVTSLLERYPNCKYYDEADMFPLDIGNFHFENLNTYTWEEENDRSLVFNLDFQGKKWLFTGDAPSKVEAKIIEDHPELDCDILKVGHHGSSTSTSAAFLDVVTPEVAIISCGVNNKYGHPNDDVLQRLEERNIKIRRTDLEGTITYTYWG